MPYEKLRLPSGTPVDIVNFSRTQLDPLFADVHAMLMLPLPAGHVGLDQAGCNLTSALILLEIAGGIARKKDTSGKPTDIFLDTMEKYFPWEQEPSEFDGSKAMTGRKAAEALYYFYRNPLAHALGTTDGKSPTEVVVTKSPMDDDAITKFEQSEYRPYIRQPTLGDDGLCR